VKPIRRCSRDKSPRLRWAWVILLPNCFRGKITSMLIDISRLGGDFPFNGVATTRRFLQSKRPVVVNFMKAYLEAIKVGLENKPFTKKILATHGGVTDEEILETAYDIYIHKIRSKVPYPVNRGWKTLIDFTARDIQKFAM
jgi:hypothetical protein